MTLLRSVRLPGALLAGLVAGLFALGVAVAPAASAHAGLESTSPTADAKLTAPPTEVVLTFTENITGVGTEIRVTAPPGVVSTGATRVIDNTVHQDLAPGSGGGTYQVAWRATSADGHPVSGTFSFEVAGAIATPSSSSSAGPGSSGASGSSGTLGSSSSALPDSTSVGDGTEYGPMLWVLIGVSVLLVGAAAWVSTRRPEREE